MALTTLSASPLLSAEASANSPLPSIDQQVRGMRAFEGLFRLYWDARKGRLWLEIPRFDQDFLYVTGLPAGLGSNDIGLDRGMPGPSRVVRFIRSGKRVLLVQRNMGFRAPNGSPAERRAVEESFAQSVLAGFDVAAEEQGKALVDATDFFLSDAFDVIGTLRQSKQGAYKLDAKRSAVDLPGTKNFPKNTVVDALLTFSCSEPGDLVKSVAPDPQAITLRERHNFVELPDAGFRPRAYDPRAGLSFIGYEDFSSPIDQPLVKRWSVRHRLEKQDPNAPRSPALKPLVYYIDPAMAEPVRSAVREGAGWWEQAFEAAGFIGAFRVEMLPEDVDPLDVRYNVIEWVHRSTRGWSYGDSIVDPRTGEIIQGHVSLDSLRVRQDFLIAEGLLAPYQPGKPASSELERLVLARLRQLAAHEVGHTLGLEHNFIASAEDRASVMDYPFPLIRLTGDGTLDLSEAYATGIGAWDKVAIAYGYTQFKPGTDEQTALDKLLSDARDRGLSFLSDPDARPPGSAHPMVHLWDNGTNAVDELRRVLRVRKAALERFGENVIPEGRPLATIEDALVPVFLLHRYQIQAAAKVVGGVTYNYALRGDHQTPAIVVPADEQRRALAALLQALSPDELMLPQRLLSLIPPRPPGYPRTAELFDNRTGGVFDDLAPPRAAAELALGLLMNRDRAERLVQQQSRDPAALGLGELLKTVLNSTWRQDADEAYAGGVQRSVADVALTHLLILASDTQATTQARAEAASALLDLKQWLESALKKPAAPSQRAHELFALRKINLFLDHPESFQPPAAPSPPPGQPIGEIWTEPY